MADDRFVFVFSPEDAQAAARAAEIYRLGDAFGFRDAERVTCGMTPDQMAERGWWFDTASLHWLPFWWPRWSDG